MSRNKKGIPIHGWLNIDKPQGLTSHQVIGRVRRALNAQKVGHAGTLDPLATGVMPIALGEATKTVSFVQDRRKVYRFMVRWGAETDTGDAEGTAVPRPGLRPDVAAIVAVLPDFIGELMQQPPA